MLPIMAAALRRPSTALCLRAGTIVVRNLTISSADQSSFATKLRTTSGASRHIMYNCDTINTCSKRTCKSRSANDKNRMINNIPAVNGQLKNRIDEQAANKQRDPAKWLYKQTFEKLEQIRAQLQNGVGPQIERKWKDFETIMCKATNKAFNNTVCNKVLRPMRDFQNESAKAAVERQKYREEIQKMAAKRNDDM